MDDNEFVEACRANMPFLYRISMSLLRMPQDAQDAVQQGLMKAWENRDRAYPGKEKAWMTRIVLNECRNIQRHRMRVFPVDTLPEQTAPAADPVLYDAISALPEKYRLALLLKYMEGMSESEVAKALGCTVSTVKSRLFRARKALEKALQEEVSFQ